MSDEILVNVEGVSKKFCRSLKRSLWYGVQDVSREIILQKRLHPELRKNEFWAVKNVSFQLRRGECLGLIGPNGAGKSTLLKMLNGLVKPDKGRICMRGRIGALIELGAGFDPILTARENIFVNGSVLGFGRKEIKRKFDAIVDFAEVEEFIDTPVQHFSSGMKVRLGFAVAAQMTPDVLLIDEVLAVGDASFRAKCLSQMGKISAQTAMVFVSHSMPLISRVASSILSIDQGRTLFFGNDVPSGIESYQTTIQTDQISSVSSDYFEMEALKINSIECQKNSQNAKIEFGKPFLLEMQLRSRQATPEFSAMISFIDIESKGVAQVYSLTSGQTFKHETETFRLAVRLQEILLNPGRYFVQIALIEHLGAARRGRVLLFCRAAAELTVTGEFVGHSPVQLIGTWNSDD